MHTSLLVPTNDIKLYHGKSACCFSADQRSRSFGFMMGSESWVTRCPSDSRLLWWRVRPLQEVLERTAPPPTHTPCFHPKLPLFAPLDSLLIFICRVAIKLGKEVWEMLNKANMLSLWVRFILPAAESDGLGKFRLSGFPLHWKWVGKVVTISLWISGLVHLWA